MKRKLQVYGVVQGVYELIKGSCLCGRVTYAISGKLGKMIHCHCTTCRKAHGSAFSTVAAVDANEFEITTGAGLVRSFKSSPGKARYFCSNCGSQLYAHREGQSHYILRLGTLDDDPGVAPAAHIWISDKAPWYQPETDCSLPMYPEWEEKD